MRPRPSATSAAAAAAALAFAMGVAARAHAGSDLDVFTPGASVQPNAMLIFDNSGSMNDPIPYQPGTTYAGSYTAATKYSRCTGWTAPPQCYCKTNSNTWKTQAQEGSNGFLAKCGFVDGNNDGQDDRNLNESYVKLGNRLNYQAAPGASKMSIAKTSVDTLLADPGNASIRFGLMTLNGTGGFNANYSACGNSTSLYHNDKTILKVPIGAATSAVRSVAATLTAQGWTPLAPRLIAAARYFKKDGYFPAGSDPIQYACQRNFVVLMTDGRPTIEGDVLATDYAGEFDYIENWLGQPYDYDGDGRDPDKLHDTQPAACTKFTYCGRQSSLDDIDTCEYAYGGSDYLDDVAKKIYDQDLRADLTGKQTVGTYTIGFTVGNDLLQRTATLGGGEYFTANSAAELNAAFKEALKSIISNTESFVAPVVPVSQTTKTQSGDEVFMTFFRPRSAGFSWDGNLKKYRLDESGNLIDADGQAATDSDGNLKASAKSKWETTPSGPSVVKGGVGELLRTRVTPRNIYTNITGTVNVDLTTAGNAFTATNASLTIAKLSVANATEKTKLVNYIHGVDTYDDDKDLNVTEKRDWILGDMIHSSPLVVDYGASNRAILVGANDGMLHAFDDTTGAELWAFIPDIHLTRLKLLPSGASATHQSFVDGSPRLRIIGSQKIVVFGMGRGGRAYYALDVTNKNAPKLLWKVTNASTGMTELGETWSEPTFSKYGGVDVMIVGGGYDAYFDDPKKAAKNSSGWGRGIFVLKVLDGKAPAGLASPLLKPSGMDFAIPSKVAVLDLNADGAFDRAWVGDLGGQLWRIDGKTLAVSKVFSTSSGGGLRIFFPPDVTRNEGYLSLFFGTGDRSNPLDTKSTKVPDRMYMVKDDGTSNLTENDLVDVTNQVKQNGSAAEATLAATLKTKKGWFIQFVKDSGEKVLSSPSTYFSVYFTTFTPLTGACDAGGDARVYTLNDGTGGIPDTVADPDGDGPLPPKTVTAADRSMKIGTGIPTEVRLTVQKDKASGFVGSTGQIDRVALPAFPNNVTPLSWRECSTVAPCN